MSRSAQLGRPLVGANSDGQRNVLDTPLLFTECAWFFHSIAHSAFNIARHTKSPNKGHSSTGSKRGSGGPCWIDDYSLWAVITRFAGFVAALLVQNADAFCRTVVDPTEPADAKLKMPPQGWHF